MAVNSKLLDVLPEGYGFVILTAVGGYFVNWWLVLNVMKARKEFNVKVSHHFYSGISVDT